MAHTQELEIQGFKMKVTFEILEVPRERIIEELENRGYKPTEENINELTSVVKSFEEYEFHDLIEQNIINGESGSGYCGDYSIFDAAFDNDIDLEEEDEEA